MITGNTQNIIKSWRARKKVTFNWILTVQNDDNDDVLLYISNYRRTKMHIRIIKKAGGDKIENKTY